MLISKRSTIAVVVICGLAAVLAFAQAHRSLPQPDIRLKTPEVTVPMDLTSGIPVVQLTVNGKGPYPFVVDTGAAGTVLSDSLAQELGLQSVGEVEVHSPMGDHSLPGKLVRIDTIEFGQAVLENVMAVAFDASNVFHKPDAPRGVLSANSFNGYLLTLNYPQSRLELQAGELPSADGKQILDFEASGPLISIPVRIAGTEIHADLDSGSIDGIMLPGEYAKQLPLSGGLTQAETRHTVDATVEHQKGTLSGELKIGGFSANNPEIIFSDRSPHANVGSKFLSRFSITVDRKNHRVQLKEG